MFRFLDLEPDIFGIDINDLSIKIVKLKKSRNVFRLVSFNEVSIKRGIIKEGVIQDQDALSDAIRWACDSVKGKKLATTYVIASLPEEKSFSQVIQMPKMTDEELQSAVPFEAENYIPLPIDKVYLDFQVIDAHSKDHNNHLDLLINGMPKSIVDSYVFCFKKVGLTPCILEVESQAITRALIKNKEEVPPLLIIDLGVANTGFIIFSGGSIRFTSSISISSEQITHTIADKLGVSISKAEALKLRYGLSSNGQREQKIKEVIHPIILELADQIKRYINFYQGHVSHEYFPSEGNIEKIILCGGGANLKKLPDFLSKELKMPVETGNPLVNLKKDGYLSSLKNPLAFTTAIGLALRGANKELYD